MIKKSLLVVFPVIGIVLQTTLFDKISFFNAKPDLLLTLVILYSLIYGQISGAKLGFFYGLFEDLISGRYIGMNAICKMLTGYLLGLGKGKIFRDNILVPIIAVFSGSIIYYLCFFILGVTTSLPIIFSVNKFFKIAFFSALYNTFLAPILYGFFNKIMTVSK